MSQLTEEEARYMGFDLPALPEDRDVNPDQQFRMIDLVMRERSSALR